MVQLLPNRRQACQESIAYKLRSRTARLPFKLFQAAHND